MGPGFRRDDNGVIDGKITCHSGLDPGPMMRVGIGKNGPKTILLDFQNDVSGGWLSQRIKIFDHHGNAAAVGLFHDLHGAL